MYVSVPGKNTPFMYFAQTIKTNETYLDVILILLYPVKVTSYSSCRQGRPVHIGEPGSRLERQVVTLQLKKFKSVKEKIVAKYSFVHRKHQLKPSPAEGNAPSAYFRYGKVSVC
jgi:hypothetical protein